MKGYKFIRSNYRSFHGDEGPWREGEKRTVKGPPVVCEHGYHACRDWRYCLDYVCGPVGMVVELGGEIYKGLDKIVGTECTVLKIQDVGPAFRLLVREEVAHVSNLLSQYGREVPKYLPDVLDLLRQHEAGTISRDALIQHHRAMEGVYPNGAKIDAFIHRLCQAATLSRPDDALLNTFDCGREVTFHLDISSQEDAWLEQHERQLEHFAKKMEEVFGT